MDVGVCRQENKCYLCAVQFPSLMQEQPRLLLNSKLREATYGDHSARLTRLEYALLHYLYVHPNSLCTRSEVVDNVWGTAFHYDTGTVDVHLNAIRRKLGFTTAYPIETVRGEGFLFHSNQEAIPYYRIDIGEFIPQWMQSHALEFQNHQLEPQVKLDPFVREIAIRPDVLHQMLDGILVALLSIAQPGTICITSHLTLDHFSLSLDVNGMVNELRIPIA